MHENLQSEARPQSRESERRGNYRSQFSAPTPILSQRNVHNIEGDRLRELSRWSKRDIVPNDLVNRRVDVEGSTQRPVVEQAHVGVLIVRGIQELPIVLIVKT